MKGKLRSRKRGSGMRARDIDRPRVGAMAKLAKRARKRIRGKELLILA